MNNSNLRKRRPYGHEGAPGVPAAHDPSYPALVPYVGTAHPVDLSQTEINILTRAATILNCSVTELYNLDNRNPDPPLLHDPYSSYIIPSKRPRLSTDPTTVEASAAAVATVTEMPPPLTSPTVNQDIVGHHAESSASSGFTLGVGPSRLAQYLVNFSVCSPCVTCEPQGYPGMPAVSPYGYIDTRPYLDNKTPVSPHYLMPSTLSQAPPGVFAAAEGPIMTQQQQMFPDYTLLQPTSRFMAVQPTTSGEGMVYPGPVPSQGYPDQAELQQASLPMSPSNHITRVHAVTAATTTTTTTLPSSERSEEPRKQQYSAARTHANAEADRARMPTQLRELDIVQLHQRPPPARRGPFRDQKDRERTAETRRIGSCIRCRMQRIRCDTNPDDKFGTCLTCSRVSNVKIFRMPCLRFKITDVRLFKPGPVKGHEWTRRWVEGVPDDISHWASIETRIVQVTEGYTQNTVELRVRQFVPQDGDSLERSWVYNGVRKRVAIPAYAIINLDEAKSAYSNYISRNLPECCKNVLSGKDRLLGATYFMALKVARDPKTDEKERVLLRKALQLWMAVRMTTKSTFIVGEETLGMSPDIMDETSPLRGKIPLPPVMGAQIELVLIHQIQSNLRREMLENLQSMTQANKQQTWFTTYLITFMLLHNVALLCQHDTGYSRKHGMKTRFAREDMVREYQLGANILLAYFHYCNKGIYPFSPDCKEQDLRALAGLDEHKTQFIRLTKGHIERQKKSWAKLRESRDYENDFYYISQLFEENWTPQSTSHTPCCLPIHHVHHRYARQTRVLGFSGGRERERESLCVCVCRACRACRACV
ncbi:hypothetical protein GGR50DRAFT_106078 [Xylaria sp. CBS 124048]|nr:hypothetical protein GGR50DRAFT_106078 [Xylaria sp. CBS 124048]